MNNKDSKTKELLKTYVETIELIALNIQNIYKKLDNIEKQVEDLKVIKFPKKRRF